MRGPSNQPYPGSLFDEDPVSSRLSMIGQINPNVERRWALQHGRYLAGFGGHNETRDPGDVAYCDPHLAKMEGQDDVYGSGIFDPNGRSGTVHPNMGVFADNVSLPGYIDREVMYQVSKDVVDYPSGADVVVVAGGGMAYIECDGLRRQTPCVGFRPCPPAIAPARPTTREQVYVSTVPAPQPRMLPPMPPPGPMIVARPRQAMLPARAAPMRVPRPTPKMLPSTTMPGPVTAAPPPMMAVAIAPKKTYPGGPPGAPPPKPPYVVKRPTKKGPTLWFQGFGEEAPASGVGTYLFAGVLVGAAAAMLFGATKMRA